MKSFLLLMDGAVTALGWLIFLVVISVVAVDWYQGSYGWKESGLILLALIAFSLVVPALYRLFTFPIRTEIVTQALHQRLREGLITREQLDGYQRAWRGNYLFHILFGSAPT